MLDPLLLRSFVAIIDTGSFTRAGERVHLTQSTISQQIARLEDQIKLAAKEAIKGTPLEGSKIYLAGSAATFRDMAEGSDYDLMIAGISALALIFVIMLIITRAVVAAAVIVATVAISLGASLGM